MKLYGFSQFPRNTKILIAAQYAGIELTSVELNPYTATGAEKEELRKKNPNLKVPILETPEGNLYESNAILRYIARSSENSTIYGKDDFERALVDQWLDWTSGTLEPLLIGVHSPLLGFAKYEKESYEKNLEALKKTLRIIDDRVKQSKFLAGDSITIADFAIFTALRILFAFVLDEKSRKPFHHLTKYFEAVSNEENVKKVFGRPIHFSPRIGKLLVAAKYAQVELQQEDFYPRTASEDALKEYKKKNPNAKVPTLETPEGCIYESNAILRYLARLSKGHKLYGASKWEQAQVDQYLDWASTLLEPALWGFFGFILGYVPFNDSAFTQAREKFHSVLKVLEEILKKNKYLVGNQITIADIQVVSDLLMPLRFVADEAFTGHFPHVVKYGQSVGSEKQFTEVYGRVVLCKKVILPYTGPLPQEETKKAEPKKAAPQPKKEKAAPQPKKEKKEEEEEEPKEQKALNSLDSLPPSSFNLFDYKTLFVNHPDKKEALKTFWEQLDDQGYSVWRMEYEKAEGEGKVGFLTSNLMNGFLQRLESFRKYAFGIVGVYGDEPNLEIRGCWVWRGTEVPFEIKDHPSGEWYKFRKLDVKNNEADRKIQEEYWTKWEEDVDKVEGLTCRDVKYFK